MDGNTGEHFERQSHTVVMVSELDSLITVNETNRIAVFTIQMHFSRPEDHITRNHLL